MSIITEQVEMLRTLADIANDIADNSTDTVSTLREAADTIEQLAANVREENGGGWIPIAERLPEKEEKNYWVCLNNGNQCQCRWLNIKHIFSDVKTDDWHWSVTDIDPFSKVIAWKPLPEPYKEEK